MTFIRFFIALMLVMQFTPAAAQTSDADNAGAPDETILVVGATGRTGFRIAQLLLKRDLKVRGMTRDVASAESRFGSDIEWVSADITKPESLTAAFTGIHRVINAAGTEARGGPNGPKQVNYLGMINLVDAAKVAGVEYFSLISSGGVADANEYLSLGLEDGVTWGFKGEQYLRQSGMTYTIVRAAGMRDYPAGENGILLLQQDEIPPGLITRSDVAEVMVESLLNDGAANKTFHITNYIALDPESWRNQLELLAED